MINNGAAVHEFTPAAEVINAGAKVGIRANAASEESLIEAVDGEDIVAPESHVTSDNAALFFVTENDGRRQSNGFSNAFHSARQHPAPYRAFARLELGDKSFFDVAAPSLNPEVSFGEPF